MCEPLWFRKKIISTLKKQFRKIGVTNKKYALISALAAVLIPGSMAGFLGDQAKNHVLAYTMRSSDIVKTVSPLFENDDKLFAKTSAREIESIEAELVEQKKQDIEKKKKNPVNQKEVIFENQKKKEKINSPILAISEGENSDKGVKIPGLRITTDSKDETNLKFAEKLYEIVGEAPIKEMIPFISERDERVAAFLVGIAKKESSFGFASPSKEGKTCYNYWGYKGSAGRGTGMGYACFASAEEAIQIVGDRIEVLVGKERNTPARMVDTWKCGRSCASDPGAPGWVSTVALYFNQIVSSKNS